MRPRTPLAARYLLFAAVLGVAGCEKAASNDGSAAADSGAAETADVGADAPQAARSVDLPVAVAEVRDGDLVLSVTSTGQVRSDGEATLKAEVAGTIESVLVRPGDRVTKGQVLLRMDPRPFELSVQEAQAAVDEAEVRYQDVIAPDSIVTGRAPSEQLRRIALTRSGLQGARVRLEKAKYERERSRILAPFNGMVDRVDRSAGERVTAGETITRVVNLGALRIEASVLEHDLPLVREGGAATVTSTASRDRAVQGRVSAVLPMIDTTTRAGRVFIRIPNTGALRPGMYADVRLEADRLKNRRLVPARAIIERDGRPLVFVVKEGRAQWVYVNAGRSNGIDTEVLPDSGTGLIPVEPGDRVIVSGHLTLTHDAPVREVADTTVAVNPRVR